MTFSRPLINQSACVICLSHIINSVIFFRSVNRAETWPVLRTLHVIGPLKFKSYFLVVLTHDSDCNYGTQTISLDFKGVTT